VTVSVADWLVADVAPVALAAARYLVPLFAVVSPVRVSVVLVALVTFAQVVPASVDDCHWYEIAPPPDVAADAVKFAAPLAATAAIARFWLLPLSCGPWIAA
jgi:hypothetical protein